MIKIQLLVVTTFIFLISVWQCLKDIKEAKVVPLSSESRIAIDTVSTGLNVPWEIIWGPDRYLWITEQSGTISRINPQTGRKTELVRIKEVLRLRTLGLLGMAIHPDFSTNPYVFVDYTTRKDSVNIVCRLVKFTYKSGKLIAPKVLLEFPAAMGHNGSRIVISPDKKIMFATGDAASLTSAQDIKSLNGKVLRINTDGSIPVDNPVKGSYVWSLGHRNIQGLAYGPDGILYASEHGDAIEDEVNIIRKGANYGWIKVEGYCDQPAEKAFCDSVGVTEPIKAWTPTIAPAGITFYNNNAVLGWKNSILLTTLKDRDLRVLHLDKEHKKVISESVYFDQIFGRLRAVCQSPEGDVYLATSNRDWNPGKGFPKISDDKIIRVRKSASGKPLSDYLLLKKESQNVADRGKEVYKLYCASCHKEDGLGVASTFPPLKNAGQVLGPQKYFLKIIIYGLSGQITVLNKKYEQHMPAFGFLKDEDLAAVASYVRKTFGNDKTEMTVSDVAAARKRN